MNQLKWIIYFFSILFLSSVGFANFDFSKSNFGQDCKNGFNDNSNLNLKEEFEITWEKSSKPRLVCTGSIPFVLPAGKQLVFQDIVLESEVEMPKINFDIEVFLNSKNAEKIRIKKTQLGKSESLKSALASFKSICGDSGLLRWNASAFGGSLPMQISKLKFRYTMTDCK